MSNNFNWNPFLHFPRTCLALTLLVLVPVFLQIRLPSITPETSAFLEGDKRNSESYEKVMAILKQEVVVAISVGGLDVFSESGMQTIREISDAFYGQKGLQDVKSFTHSVKPVRRGFSFSMEPLVSENPGPEELAALREFSLNNPLIRNVMVSEDARNTILLNTYHIRLDTPEARKAFHSEVESILHPFRNRGLEIHCLGLPLIENEVRQTLKKDLSRFVPAAALVVTGLLLLIFRSWLIVLFCLVNLFFLLAFVPLILQFLGFPVTVYTLLLIPLITAIHLGLQVHLFSGLQTAARNGKTGKAAVETMLQEIFKPSAFAVLTTLVGLASLLISEVEQVRDFGSLGVLGLSIIFLITFGPGLSLLVIAMERSRLYPTSSPTGSPSEDRSSFFCSWVHSNRKTILLGGMVVMGISAFGLTRIRTDVRAIEFLSKSSPTRKAVEKLDGVYGGVNVVQLEFDTGKENGINQSEFLKWMDSLQSYADSLEPVSSAYSYSQLLAMMNQIWEGEKPGSYKVPDSPLLLNVFSLALRTQNLPFLAALCDPGFQKAYFIIRTRDMPSDLYLEVFHKVVDRARETAPLGVRVLASKGIHSILESDRRIMQTQMESAGATVACILAVLIVIWKSPRMSGISLISNLLAVAAVMAIMSFLQTPLNSVTIMVGAIALGIAVDDSVHFISHWKHEREQQENGMAAMQRTYQIKLRPIIASSLVMSAVFMLFTISSFPPIRQFGILCSSSFLFALASVLLLIPAMIWETEKD